MKSTRTGPRWAAMMVVAILMMLSAAIASSAQGFKTLVDFNGTNGLDSYTSLVQGTGGNLYGTTGFGGANGWGTVFKMTPAGALTTIYSFCAQPNCADGSTPLAALALGTDGNFYGATFNGGSSVSCSQGCGVVFKITPTGTFSTLYSFCAQTSCTDGASPAGALVQGANGQLYGTTSFGGTDNAGTVFKISPAGILTTLHSFDNIDGAQPSGALIQGADGTFYGTTSAGGAHTQGGTVFEMTPAGTLKTLYSFCAQINCTDGSNPFTPLVQATDGNFYGSTLSGGTNNEGTIFKITLGGVLNLTTLHSFHGSDGNRPSAVIQATDGNFYGTTNTGGNYADGTIFKIDSASGTLSTVHAFDGTDGRDSWAAPFQATNGSFYGTTFEGGTSDYGTVFGLSVGLGPFVETLPTTDNVGRSVTILGTNLTGATSVTFNSTAATFTVESATTIRTTVPTGATTGPVQVVTPSGTLTSNVNFRVKP